MKTSGRLGLAALIGLAALQLVPVSRSNPPVSSEVPAPADVRAILERSCYDCHSNQTRFPWYAWVAPVSFLVAYDLSHAREHMNFSTWDAYDAEERADHFEEIWEEVEGGEMPLWYYTLIHRDARLSDAELRLLQSWTAAGAKP